MAKKPREIASVTEKEDSCVTGRTPQGENTVPNSYPPVKKGASGE